MSVRGGGIEADKGRIFVGCIYTVLYSEHFIQHVQIWSQVLRCIQYREAYN